MTDFYINTIDIISDNFKIKSEEIYDSIEAKLKELNKQEGLFLKLLKANFTEYFIQLTLNPQEYHTKSKYGYKTNIDESKFIQIITRLESEIQSIELEKLGINIRPIEEWEVTFIEISKDIELKHQFFNYIETIKSINPKRKGQYSIIGTYDNDTCIYFNTKPKDNSRNYNTHIRFENKVKMAKPFDINDEELQQVEENILKCTIMLKKHYVAGYQRGLTISYSNFYDCLIGYSGNYDECSIKIADIIQDFQSDLSRYQEYFTDTLGENLFTEDFTALGKFKDDTKLLDSIIEREKAHEKSILMFIIIKLLRQLDNYNFAPIRNFLKNYHLTNIKKIRGKVIDKITKYRNTYRKYYETYSIEDLYQEIKSKLILD